MIKFQNLFSSEDLCTWNLDEDSCKGDSGGPLFLSENDRFVACCMLNFDEQVKNQLHAFLLLNV